MNEFIKLMSEGLQVCQRLTAVLVCVCSLSSIALAYEGSRDTDLIVSALPTSGRVSEQAGTHTNLDKLHQQGLAIFKQLDLQGAELTFIGKVFALPTVSWSFKKSEKLETLLRSIAHKSHVFKYLDVVNGLIIMQADLPKGKALLQLQADGPHAYSGSLSIMESPSLTGLTSIETTNRFPQEPVFRWLQETGQMLMDIESYESEVYTRQRQWVYLLPFELDAAQEQIRHYLQANDWLEQESFGLSLKQWQKQGQVMSYHLDHLDQQTTLYLNYSKHIKDAL